MGTSNLHSSLQAGDKNSASSYDEVYHKEHNIISLSPLICCSNIDHTGYCICDGLALWNQSPLLGSTYEQQGVPVKTECQVEVVWWVATIIWSSVQQTRTINPTNQQKVPRCEIYRPITYLQCLNFSSIASSMSSDCSSTNRNSEMSPAVCTSSS